MNSLLDRGVGKSTIDSEGPQVAKKVPPTTLVSEGSDSTRDFQQGGLGVGERPRKGTGSIKGAQVTSQEWLSKPSLTCRGLERKTRRKTKSDETGRPRARELEESKSEEPRQTQTEEARRRTFESRLDPGSAPRVNREVPRDRTWRTQASHCRDKSHNTSTQKGSTGLVLLERYVRPIC